MLSELNILLGSGVKLPRNFFFVVADLALQNMDGIIFSVFIFFLVFVYSWSTLLWYRCYYAHRSRDSMSPICRIFFFFVLWSPPKRLVLAIKGPVTRICFQSLEYIFLGKLKVII